MAAVPTQPQPVPTQPQPVPTQPQPVPTQSQPVPSGRPSSESARSFPVDSEPRVDERLGAAVGVSQQKVPTAITMGVLAIALFLGLIGFAVEFFWIVAIIVLALGLGYTVANSRRDRVNAEHRRTEARARRG